MINEVIITLSSGIATIVAALILAIIGTRAYKKQKVYEKKEQFYLSFLKDMIEMLNLIKETNDAKSNHYIPNIKDNKNLLKKMKKFLDKHSADMMIYATYRFKKTFVENFLFAGDKEEKVYNPLISASILIEEAKKDLKSASKSTDEKIINLAIYASINDIKEQKDFAKELKQA